MKASVKKGSEKALRKIAEELAGPVTNWITPAERNAYIKGVMEGIKRFEDLKMR